MRATGLSSTLVRTTATSSSAASVAPSAVAAASPAAPRRRRVQCEAARSSSSSASSTSATSPSAIDNAARRLQLSSVAATSLCRRRHSHGRRGSLRPFPVVAAAESGEGEAPTTTTSSSGSDGSDNASGGDRLVSSTLSALDALLGVEPDDKKKKGDDESSSSGSSSSESQQEKTSISFSPDVLKALAEAEAARGANSGSGSSSGGSNDADQNKDNNKSPPPSPADLSERMSRLAEAAKRASSSDVDDAEAQRILRTELEKLAEAVGGGPAGAALRATREDLLKIKDAAFGPRVFWVTETAPLDPFLADGWLIRGNLRAATCAEALDHVTKKVAELFADKYTVLMIDDPGSADGGDGLLDSMMMDEATGGMGRSPARQSGGPGAGSSSDKKDGGGRPKPPPRVAFQVVLSAAATPPPPSSWQPLASLVLAALSLGSSVQLGMAANVFRLPPAILEWLADPAGLSAAPDGSLPPFVAEFDPAPFVASALPIAAAVLGVQAAHELGHFVAAKARKLKSGVPLLVPNGQLGTFGAVTQLRSLAEDRASLFDFAAAGPFAGGAVAAALFLAGLAMSVGGGGGGGSVAGDAASAAAAAASSGLIPVPAALLQGSLLLGGLTNAVLGGGGVGVGAGAVASAGTAAGAAAAAKAAGGAALLVHPMLVAGWAGLVATAFNLLPVGRLDGGRMVQSAFGRGPLAATSFVSYVGLALGFLGSALALPFGLYVLVCQRDPENAPRDGVTEPSSGRQLAAAVAVAVALLVLLPAAPDAASVDALGGGGGGMFL